MAPALYPVTIKMSVALSLAGIYYHELVAVFIITGSLVGCLVQKLLSRKLKYYDLLVAYGHYSLTLVQ